MVGFGEIHDTCVLLMTMDSQLNRKIADEVVKMPGFDESLRKTIDINGVGALEEEEIHFVMLRDPDDISSQSDSTHEQMHRELDDIQDYMRSAYPNTHTVGYKLLYGDKEKPHKRLEKYLEKTGSDFLMIHRDQVDSLNSFIDEIPRPVVVIG